ncbi:FAD-dependent thymidylate synthase [Parafrankia sp. EUN1f]|uniref:FAD-dependent thymidylate synthase n=1 Tax=Parafrankia sp. EUN1f TaxID=102897 RepID=UPI000680CB3C|nr:FAD-dependent thymidylate synthase [Parafrankia sp. EUN1f]
MVTPGFFEAVRAEGLRTLASLPDAHLLTEFAGRECYQSWTNPAGRTNHGYIGHLIDQGHESVFEHATVTFRLTSVSRSLLTELTRHRHLSFSVQSQRYVDESEAFVIVPPDLRDIEDREVLVILNDAARGALDSYETIVDRLTVEHGWTRKKARSAARAVLPNMTETRIVVTGNHRSWREVIRKRAAPGADREIRDLAGMLLRELRAIAPALYQDMTDNDNGGGNA